MKTFIIIFFAACLMSLSSCVATFDVQPGVTVIRTLPSHHYKIVRVHGKRYYHCNGHHYRKVRGGYVIVNIH
ncbi:MAG TPA: hypothetical protein VGA80_11265 [Flavobacteriaceae bacterium]|jgi:hypothetical protein